MKVLIAWDEGSSKLRNFWLLEMRNSFRLRQNHKGNCTLRKCKNDLFDNIGNIWRYIQCVSIENCNTIWCNYFQVWTNIYEIARTFIFLKVWILAGFMFVFWFLLLLLISMDILSMFILTVQYHINSQIIWNDYDNLNSRIL